MAHPHKAQAVSSNRTKFKAVSGKSGSGQAHSMEGQGHHLLAQQAMREQEMKASGSHAGSRLDKYARGGRTKKHHTQVNIVLPQGQGASPPVDPAMGSGAPPMRPPVAPGGAPPPPMRKGGKVPMTGGAETGIGRLDKIKAYGKRAKAG